MRETPGVLSKLRRARSKLGGAWSKLGGDRLQRTILAVAVIGAVIAVLAWRLPSGGSTTPRASIRFEPQLYNPILPVPISAVASPPRYSPTDAREHCNTWSRWFAEQRAAEHANPFAEISAPRDAPVTITSAVVHVYRSYKPRAVSYILCDTEPPGGADLAPTTEVTVSLSHPTPVVKFIESEAKTRLLQPSTAGTVRPGSTTFVAVPAGGDEGLTILATGDCNRIYEWSLDLRAIIDQREQTLSIGSEKSPLRDWFGAVPQRGYDYDLKRNSWSPPSLPLPPLSPHLSPSVVSRIRSEERARFFGASPEQRRC